MTNEQKQRKIRSFWAYLPTVIKFHRLKVRGLTQIVFAAMLAVQMIGQYFISNTIAKQDSLSDYSTFKTVLIIPLLATVIGDFICTIYLSAFLCELRGKEYSFKKYLRIYLKNLVSILILVVIMNISMILVPIYFMYLFGLCYVFDLHLGLGEALSASKCITNGHKRLIFNLVLSFLLMFWVPVALIISGDSMVSLFITSFLGTIISLMYQRLIALMYVDLEYGYVEKSIENS
jgi:hypothetical protein